MFSNRNSSGSAALGLVFALVARGAVWTTQSWFPEQPGCCFRSLLTKPRMPSGMPTSTSAKANNVINVGMFSTCPEPAEAACPEFIEADRPEPAEGPVDLALRYRSNT